MKDSARPLRVLALAPTNVPMSGWGRYAHAVGRELTKQGIEYTLLAEMPDPEHPERPYLLKRTKFSLFRNILTVRRAVKNVDIVHAFDIWPYGIYGFFAVLGSKKKLFMTGVATYSIAPARKGLKWFLMWLASKKARAIFSVSAYTKSRIYKRMPTDNNVVVYWGASSIPTITPEKVAEYRIKYNIHDTKTPILLTVGEIKHRKGQFDVVRAIPELKKQYPNILYCIVGSDKKYLEYTDAIREYAKQEGIEANVKVITDAKTDESLAFFYTIANIFLLTSNNEGDHFEGFGLVFLEAEQFGKPVIGTLGCGVEEAQQPGYNGYLVRQSDPKDIAEKVEKTVSGNKELLGEHSKDFASRFTWEKTVKEYIKHYRK